MSWKLSTTHLFIGYRFQFHSRSIEIIISFFFVIWLNWLLIPEEIVCISCLRILPRHLSRTCLSESNISLVVSYLTPTTTWPRISESCNCPKLKILQVVAEQLYRTLCFLMILLPVMKCLSFVSFVRFTDEKLINFL